MAAGTRFYKQQQPRNLLFGTDHQRVRQSFVDDFLQACYGDVTKLAAKRTAGEYLTKCVEQQMLACETETAPLLEKLRGPSAEASYLEQQLEISTVVVGLMRSLGSQTTIDHLVQELFTHYKLELSESRQHEEIARHLIFAIIGWTSMLYTAKFERHFAPTDFAITTAMHSVAPTARRQPAPWSQRPIGALLRSDGHMPVACPPGAQTHGNTAALLAVTHMNFFSLSTLGDVTITWVDDLASHCQFDRYSASKELKLFRSPSLCAIMCLEQTESLIGRQVAPISLFRAHSCQNECRASRETIIKAYLIEVLLTYRLLFGQHPRSRQIFRESQRERAKRNDRVDPLLDALCAQKDVCGFDEVVTLLHERGVYNLKTTFPHIGLRLGELEEYSTDQRPRSLLEVWNDVRDPERHITFRAVLVVGGVSILLSFLQVIIGLTQIAIAAKT